MEQKRVRTTDIDEPVIDIRSISTGTNRDGYRGLPVMLHFLLNAKFLFPGSYHVYLVVNVFLGKPGYTFDDFPQFED